MDYKSLLQNKEIYMMFFANYVLMQAS